MRRTIIFGLAVAAIAAVGVADAKVSTLAKAGSWTTSGGTTDNGKPICTMASSGGGLWFGVKYFKDDTSLTIQVSHEDWKLKDDRKIKVTMQFDKASPWTATSTSFHMSDGDAALEYEVPNKNITNFLKEFTASSNMVLRFPDEKAIDDWKLNLNGTEKVISSFADCLQKM